MTEKEDFLGYVQAFEEAYLDGEWSRLTEFFKPDAVHVTGLGAEISSRDGIIAYLQEAVKGFDRLFDARIPSFGEISQTGNTISLPWNFTYRKEGAPDLVTSGTEVAEFSHHLISRLSSVFDEGVTERVQEWMEKYENLL